MPEARNDAHSPPEADGRAVLVPARLAGLLAQALAEWLDRQIRERGARPGPTLLRLLRDLERSTRQGCWEGAKPDQFGPPLMGRSELPTVAKALVDTQAGLDDLGEDDRLLLADELSTELSPGHWR
jgi:hypothetical protein